MSTRRETQITDAFRTLTTSPHSDSDADSLLATLAGCCAELFDATVGVVLADGDGGFSVPAVSSPRAQLLPPSGSSSTPRTVGS